MSSRNRVSRVLGQRGQRLDEFYFRWLENSVIEIGKAA